MSAAAGNDDNNLITIVMHVVCQSYSVSCHMDLTVSPPLQLLPGRLIDKSTLEEWKAELTWETGYVSRWPPQTVTMTHPNSSHPTGGHTHNLLIPCLMPYWKNTKLLFVIYLLTFLPAYLVFMHESSYCFQRVLAIAILSVCPSVCYTGGSVKNGAS